MASILGTIGALGEAILPNRRRAQRTIVQVAATVSSSRGDNAGMTIANVSHHGCNITGEVNWLRLGGFVSVALESGEAVTGIVRWMRDGSAGLEFMRPVPAGHTAWHELIDTIESM